MPPGLNAILTTCQTGDRVVLCDVAGVLGTYTVFRARKRVGLIPDDFDAPLEQTLSFLDGDGVLLVGEGRTRRVFVLRLDAMGLHVVPVERHLLRALERLVQLAEQEPINFAPF